MMRLFPQHLCRRHHRVIVYRRAGNTKNAFNTALPIPRIGILGRLWMRGSGLTEEQAAHSLPLLARSTSEAVIWTFILGVTIPFVGILVCFVADSITPFVIAFGIFALLAYFFLVPSQRGIFRRLYRQPLSDGEIGFLQENEVGIASELDRSYLRLVRDVVRQSVSISAETESEIQAAITYLGTALDQIPAVPLPPTNTLALRQEAEMVRAESLHQADSIISESLERRADALLRRAKSYERSELSMRRTTVLRAEIEAQIAALQTTVAAIGIGQDSATAQNLALLAESARRVAAEATNTSEAHAELDGTSTQRSPAQNNETQQIAIGRR